MVIGKGWAAIMTIMVGDMADDSNGSIGLVFIIGRQEWKGTMEGEEE